MFFSFPIADTKRTYCRCAAFQPTVSYRTFVWLVLFDSEAPVVTFDRGDGAPAIVPWSTTALFWSGRVLTNGTLAAGSCSTASDIFNASSASTDTRTEQ